LQNQHYFYGVYSNTADYGGGGVYSTSTEEWGCGRIQWRSNSRATPKGLNQTSKMKVVPKTWRTGEAQMRDNPGDEFDQGAARKPSFFHIILQHNRPFFLHNLC